MKMKRRVYASLLSLTCALWTLGAADAQTATEVRFHRFATPPRGNDPWQGVVRDAAGSFYGTAEGGRYGFGVIYKLDAAGNQTVLHSFTGLADGGNPFAGVTLDAEGNLYGTASAGGAANRGVVYILDPSGNETVLYNFTGGADGGNPEAGVILDAAGNLYGTAAAGGAGFSGVVFKLDKSGKETVLHSFTGLDGGVPVAGVVRDAAGNLYGTTYQGGSGFAGVVYQLDTAGHETVLHNFTGGADGGYPQAGLTRDSEGNLYGTCDSGGPGFAGLVYKIDTTGNETVLYSFTGGADGGNVNAGVILDPAGNLYGVTTTGGSTSTGVIFKLDKSGVETVLYNFIGGPAGNGVGGSFPFTGLVRDSTGNLYGTTQRGGAANLGVVYRLDPSGHETVLYGFIGPVDGSLPSSGVVRDLAGNIYGTTSLGGKANAGVVYRLDPAGHETLLHTFTGGADGAEPFAGLTLDRNGNLYGTTYQGGAFGYGVVYEIPAGGSEKVLYSFTGGPDGGNPVAGVIADLAGNLYGPASTGGQWNAGVIYKLDPLGHETVIYNFTFGADGGDPRTALIRDAEGNLYGTTPFGGLNGGGVIYKVNTAGYETTICSFTGGADGGAPNSLVFDLAGNLYGTAALGGTGYSGVVFKLDTTGRETVLHDFTNRGDGGLPNGIATDVAGDLYVTTQAGGVMQAGMVVMLDTAGNLSVLHSFTGGADGSSPNPGLALDASGNLYGATQYGGSDGAGLVYGLQPRIVSY
jgi:uncharacterized repeat protein (TIGR03803 family)